MKTGILKKPMKSFHSSEMSDFTDEDKNGGKKNLPNNTFKKNNNTKTTTPA